MHPGSERNSTHASVALQVVKAPGNLVISAYVTCPDITLTVTPDLKLPGTGKLLWVDLGQGKHRLGGSAFAHAYSQVRNTENICLKTLLSEVMSSCTISTQIGTPPANLRDWRTYTF